MRSVPATENLPASNWMSDFGGLEQMRRDLLALDDHLVGRLRQRRAADHQRARAIGAHAELHAVGIAEHDVDILEGHAELLGDDLRKGRLMALAVIVRADQHRDLAGRMHAHRGALIEAAARTEPPGEARRRKAAGLDIGGDSRARGICPCCAEAALRMPKPFDVGRDQRAVEAAHRIAGIVLHQHRRLIGIGLLRDHVAAADLDAVDAHLAGRDIDDALDHEGRFGPAGAAIGIDRHGVGEHHLDVAVDRGRGVDAAEQRPIEIGRDVRPEGREIAAHIGERLDAERQELAVFVERQLGLGDVIAAVAIGDVAFRAARDPFDRPLDPLGGPGDDGLFAVVELLDAEAAADIGRDHAQLVLRDVQHQRAHQEAHDMRKLAGGPQRVAGRCRDHIRRSPRAAPSDCRSGGC